MEKLIHLLSTSLGLPIGSFNNSQLEFSAGSFNSHSQLNSTSSTADRYAALKDLDEQLREAKTSDVTLKTEPSGNSRVKEQLLQYPISLSKTQNATRTNLV